jgi:hypothetical protein
MRDLGIAGLVGAHQPKAIAAQERGKPVGQEEDGKQQKDSYFTDGSPGGNQIWSATGLILRRRFQGSFHFEQFSNGYGNLFRAEQRFLGFAQDSWGTGLARITPALPEKTERVLKFQQGQGYQIPAEFQWILRGGRGAD